jgi:hypothetical protein
VITFVFWLVRLDNLDNLYFFDVIPTASDIYSVVFKGAESLATNANIKVGNPKEDLENIKFSRLSIEVNGHISVDSSRHIKLIFMANKAGDRKEITFTDNGIIDHVLLGNTWHSIAHEADSITLILKEAGLRGPTWLTLSEYLGLKKVLQRHDWFKYEDSVSTDLKEKEANQPVVAVPPMFVGQLYPYQQSHDRPLVYMAVFLGANGTGKSTLFDVFGFLHDSLTDNVKAALLKRGGYKEVISRNETGQIEIEIKFRPEPDDPLVTYELHIGLNEKGFPIVTRERPKYRRGQKGKPWHFLDFSNGSGTAIVNESEYGLEGVEEKREEQKLDSPDILAIKGLGQFQKFRQVAAIRRLIEGWHVSDFHVQAARASQDAGYAEHLSPTGENLPLVAQFMHEHYPEKMY